MILLIDNYDSFTYNLVQLAGSGAELKVVRNDSPTLAEDAEAATGIIISPGPGTPQEIGQVLQLIQRFYKGKPILGICLGHQAIGAAFGETVKQAERIYHGKASIVRRENGRLFAGVSDTFSVIRYHSLVIDKSSDLNDFRVVARSEEDQEIMAIEHKHYPLFGIQFHPESIGTKEGTVMLANFIQLCGGEKNERII
ncbi:anthranilate synthase component II [Enterococcus sp. BWR-S5]|uniref:anthranilate synthase component II n=1 Tax=Enterococcus sp. BWR-S5 TaxID=2787714 RepID=UPI001923996A|nr:aminodeoxychorismate/anthranilate synthase component II [Enterococcus sp. BWR-S5]MBL1226765.1 aminodeoxychorismate/anthranilate synthase component II [Enterococcus sp. BWR-S5]